MLRALADSKGLSVVAFNLNPVDPEADGGFACVVSDMLVVAYYEYMLQPGNWLIICLLRR